MDEYRLQTLAGAWPPLDRRRGLLLGAFFLVYFVWGSNYLAIRYAVETIPPYLLMGGRSLLAGLCLYLWARPRVEQQPDLEHWKAAAASGALLFLGCHGLLAWAEQRVPSGVAALGLATIAIWMTVLDWLWGSARRPGATVCLGLLLGLAGLAVLVGPGAWSGRVEGLGVLALLASAFSWALGSVCARRSRLPSSLAQSTGMQLIMGGLALATVSLASGEASTFQAGAVSPRSLAAFGYMVGAASLLAFTAYVWLLRVSTPSRVASYAFVNPLVAVGLGAVVGGEPLDARTAVSAVLIVAGVGAILAGRKP